MLRPEIETAKHMYSILWRLDFWDGESSARQKQNSKSHSLSFATLATDQE
jgi:hypothetical protein